MDTLPDITPFRHRFEELEARISDPSFYQNPRQSADVTREHQRLKNLLETHTALMKIGEQLRETEALARDAGGDAGIRELAASELPELVARRDALSRELLLEMAPPDPSDSRNTILEIRAGAGGEEAALFAAELFRAYARFAESKGWKVEEMNTSLSERGGFKEAIAGISGNDVYRDLKYESGVHRVQRVPATEASGRIHTSTVTVAVLPEAEEVDVRVDPNDLEISITRASGPGGQGVNTTDSAVQILHKPSGLIVTCADERSQLKNKARAMTVLRSRLLRIREEEERAKYAAHRKSQVGTGDRSERIRTYNFPQSRMTDHRIGLTLHSLSDIMEGEFGPVIAALREADMRERLSGAMAPQ